MNQKKEGKEKVPNPLHGFFAFIKFMFYSIRADRQGQDENSNHQPRDNRSQNHSSNRSQQMVEVGRLKFSQTIHNQFFRNQFKRV